MNIYKRGLTLLSVICLVVLTACGGSKEANQSASNTATTADNNKVVAAAEETTRVVQTVNGEVKVPANPQRIVTQAGLLATLWLWM